MSPFNPCAPFAPVNPVKPCNPLSPCGPIGPIEPSPVAEPAGPCAPEDPDGPAGPTGPCSPWGPAGPTIPPLPFCKTKTSLAGAGCPCKLLGPRKVFEFGKRTESLEVLSPIPMKTIGPLVPLEDAGLLNEVGFRIGAGEPDGFAVLF